MSNRTKYVVMVAIAASTTGLLSCVIKLGLNAGVSLAHLLLSSSLIGLCSFLLIMLTIGHFRLAFSAIFRLSIVGVFIGLSAFCYTKSVEYLPASIAVILQFQFTWIGVLFDAIYRQKWPNSSKWLMIILIFFGTFFAVDLINSDDQLYLSPIGVIFGLLCAICFSCYLFLNNYVETSSHWSQRSFYMMVGSVFITILLVSPSDSTDAITFDASNILYYGSIMALVGYIIPISFFAISIPKIGSAISSLLCACELPVAIIGAMLLLNESIAGLQWLGITLIFISMLIKDPDDIKQVLK